MTYSWVPTSAWQETTNVHRLMKKAGVADAAALRRWSVEDVDRFWSLVSDDLEIHWSTPFSSVSDRGRGFPWTSWFGGGRLNMVSHCIDRHVAVRPDQLAVIAENEKGETRTLSYDELNDHVTRLAALLKSWDIGVGDSVGLLLPMSLEAVISFFAILKIGAVVVPIFSGFGADAVAVRLNRSHVRVLITADGCERRGKIVPIKTLANQALAKVPSIEKVLVVRHAHNDVCWNSCDRWWHDEVDKIVYSAQTEILPAEARGMVIYTSGTTGQPKGCIHTHAGMLMQCSKELAYHFDLKAADRMLWFTDMGWMMGPWELIGVLSQGGTVVMLEGTPGYPKPDHLWQVVEKHQVTHLGIAPTAIRSIKQSGDEWVDRHPMPTLRILGSTGEPWDPESYQWYAEKVGKGRCPVINISGGTELMGCLLAPLPIEPLGSCSLGGPGLGMDVDVVNESCESLTGEIGYLICRTPAPSMTKGFLGDDARYIESYFSKWPNIWYHGDWAMREADGQWYVLGRADDTIKVAGKRVGPGEVESVLMQHADVAEAAAIGVPHPIKGEVIVGFVVVDPKKISDSLRTALVEKVGFVLGKALTPETVRFVASLPKTRSGKIVRGLIKKAYLGEPLGDTSSVEAVSALDDITKSK